MKIGVVSDTHRNTQLLVEVAQWLKGRQNIALLCHLGDDYDDVKALSEMYLEVLQVPGVYHPGYRDGSLSATVRETVMGVRLLLVHSTDKDLTPEDEQASDIILSGHTHQPELRVAEGRLYVNPGHLKADIDKHTPASFGIIDIQESSVYATIFNLKHEPVERMELVREDTGLYRAS